MRSTHKHAKIRNSCDIQEMALSNVRVKKGKIKILRSLKRPRWNQEKLAEEADLSIRLVQKLEAGGEHTIGSVAKVAKELGVSIDDLLEQDLSEIRPDTLMNAAAAGPPSPQPLLGIMHLGQLDKTILARDAEADELLALLNTRSRIVSIVAPAGFGKTALMVRTIQKALVGDDLDKLNGSEAERADLVAQAGLKGIAILNAAENPLLRLSDFSEAIDLVAGQRSNADEGKELRGFQDKLSRSGRLWIVIENAEHCFSQGNITPELRSILDTWCSGAHGVKLIMLSRFELPFPPACHATVPAVEAALTAGLPEEAAAGLLCSYLRVRRFQQASQDVLQEIVQRLHRGVVPLGETTS